MKYPLLYLINRINKNNQNLVKELGNLLDFLGGNVFSQRITVDEDEPYYCMYPDLNIERGGTGAPEEEARYRNYEIQLNALIDSVGNKYSKFRSSVRDQILI